MSCLPDPAAPLPVVGHESGALFDPRVIVGVEPDDDERQATASIRTSNNGGEVLRFSVHLASPPATSVVHVQTDGDKKLLMHRHQHHSLGFPSVQAAHGDLLLILMACDSDEDRPHSTLFVYRVHPARPWLRRLPHADSFIHSPIGIVSLGDQGEFIVADLRVLETLDRDRATGRPQEFVELQRYSSATDQWEFKPLAMPYDGDALKPFLWNTDKVFSSSSADDGPSMYWFDCHCGLLRCNVADDSPTLRFIRLPEIEIWPYPMPVYEFHGRLNSEAYRTAGACKGIVKFVHVDNGLFGTRKQSDFTVTAWALKTTPEAEEEWEEVAVLRVDDELWPLPNFKDSPLPRWAPQFPMVSAREEDEDVLHFTLQERGYGFDDWMIAVNMRHKLLLSYEKRIDTLRYTHPYYDYQRA